MDRRARRRQDRTEQLLDAAMAIVLEEGLEALTMARLADRTDAAVGAVYRYFRGKEALIAALQQRAIDGFGDDLRAALDRADGRARRADAEPRVAALHRVLVLAHGWLQDAQVAPSRHRLLDAWLSSPRPVLGDDLARQVDGRLAPVLDLCTTALTAAAELGALESGDAETRTHVLWASLHGLDHFRKRDRLQPERLRVDPLAAALLSTLLRGWGAGDDDVEAARALLPRRGRV